ncbi:hypothetical protein B9L19_01120 [Geobacillus thermocatenulatus]|uniref:Uncharacterized protein n=1 Tax=Geobacillus thermocatenulatus TaxID=33938 RepID=A0A226QCL8_9BACL|nr:hypothetical protein GT3921_02405 [Geobacillus thermocatenulatus]KLR74606.1 hypothetical protein ABH20_04920 [Geobacillus sp. T6]OXB90085.1 hypothetical protein B9L19_01120 [Geobacillus thermocatenulatus]
MPLQIEDGLLFTALRLTHRGKTIEFRRVLADTGSAGTIVCADQAAKIGIVPGEHDGHLSILIGEKTEVRILPSSKGTVKKPHSGGSLAL